MESSSRWRCSDCRSLPITTDTTDGVDVPILSSGFIASYRRAIPWNRFTGTCVAGIKPVIFLLRNVGVVRFVSANTSDTVFELGEVPYDTLDAVKVPQAMQISRIRRQQENSPCIDIDSYAEELEQTNCSVGTDKRKGHIGPEELASR